MDLFGIFFFETAGNIHWRKLRFLIILER
jgi:hypothetical protein